MRRLWLATVLTVALAEPLCASAGSDQADVALVLAIDVSGSVDDSRFALQRRGIAAALESDEVAAAVANGAHQTIEIAIVEWAEEQRLLVPWTVVREPDDLKTLATRLRRAGRSWVHTMTDPGGVSPPPSACSPRRPLLECGRSSTCRGMAGKIRARWQRPGRAMPQYRTGSP